MKSRRQPEQQSGQNCDCKAEEQYRNVQSDLDLGWNSGSRSNTGKQLDAGVGEQTTGGRAEQSERQALGQQLPDDAAMSGSQRDADRDLFLTRRARASSILAVLQQAISNKTLTAAMSVYSTPRNRPATQSAGVLRTIVNLFG